MKQKKSPNFTSFRPLSCLKKALLPQGRKPRRIVFGAYRSIVFDLDFSVETQQYLGLWETETHGFLDESLRVAEWVIDVGAGMGEVAILAAKQKNITSVFAVEPDKIESNKLERNIELNKINPQIIKIVNKFAGIGDPRTHICLDSFEVDRNVTGVVKIDVEGHELDVLRSGEHLLSEGKPLVLLETHSVELENECQSWLRKRGYSTKIIKNAWWRRIVPEHRPIEHNRWMSAQKG